MINGLRLVNFKNFADVTLRMGPFTVIVGANASGFDSCTALVEGLPDRGAVRLRTLGEEASRSIAAIRRKCREDFDHLAGRV